MPAYIDEDTSMEEAMDYIRVNKSPSPSCASELASLQKQFSEAQALVQQLESSLTTEQTNRVSAEAEALENHKRWRKTAAELRKLHTTTCQSNKISDQDLIDAAKRMRWMVRNLAATGFSEILGEPSSDKTRLSTYPRPMTEDLRQMQLFLHTNNSPSTLRRLCGTI
ncbi:uncharacterized protein PpBr36_11268 [Pyricularia pennisetigena]|uniref:uncharacterized protein n=1 Tax=Pyricularia pennisetigena TaxID=1578925 RepID=UPI00114EF605|nr:uncharacterized protein PpBr36_11268 [Pyricularia pennisetigena]TLS20436.1 hypothetical protein PpBr36_11268 [Pyricularia pennisetigena]